MKATYSRRGDTLRVAIGPQSGPVTTKRLAPDLIADFQGKEVVTLKFLSASTYFPPAALDAIVDPPAMWLTLAQAVAEAKAEGITITPSTLRGQIRNGRIAAEGLRIVGRDRQITYEALFAYLESRAPTVQTTRRTNGPTRKRVRRTAGKAARS